MQTSDVSLTILMERDVFDDLGDRLIRAYFTQRGARALFKVIRAGLSDGTLEEHEARDLCEIGEYAMDRLDKESEPVFDLATDFKNLSGTTDPILHHRKGVTS